MLDHVGECLLRHPERGQVQAGRQRPRAALDVKLNRQPRGGRPVDQRAHAGQAGLRLQAAGHPRLGRGRDVPAASARRAAAPGSVTRAEQPEQVAQFGQRRTAAGLHREQRLPGLGRGSPVRTWRAAPACTTMTLTLCVTTSCSSLAIRARSSSRARRVAAWCSACVGAAGPASRPARRRQTVDGVADDHDREEQEQRCRPLPGIAAPCPRTLAMSRPAATGMLIRAAPRNRHGHDRGVRGEGHREEGD